jgi:hypothetical protein
MDNKDKLFVPDFQPYTDGIIMGLSHFLILFPAPKTNPYLLLCRINVVKKTRQIFG